MTQLKTDAKHMTYWVTISSDEYESMKATIEAFSDKEIMGQLRKSEEDIKAGRTKPWDDFVREFKRKA